MFLYFLFLPILMAQDSGVQKPPVWIKELLTVCKANGLVSAGALPTHTRDNRYEAAVSVYEAISNVEKGLTASERRLPQSMDGEFWWDLFSRGNLALDGALVELRPEYLKMINEADWLGLLQKARGFNARVGDLWFRDVAPILGYPSFPDVPKGHWASKATSHLKANGVLKGYKRGKFNE
jgi:hypothetical protein